MMTARALNGAMSARFLPSIEAGTPAGYNRTNARPSGVPDPRTPGRRRIAPRPWRGDLLPYLEGTARRGLNELPPPAVAASPSPPPSFAELLVSTPPRERSGSRSSNRFSFQQSWGLGLLLSLHERPDDYCVLFDIHEYVIVLNSSTAPSEADLYQVKTRAIGGWTVHNLTDRDRNRETGAEKPSHLGNLYHNYIVFSRKNRCQSLMSLMRHPV
jgi:Cap4 dsDNA endonuclease